MAAAAAADDVDCVAQWASRRAFKNNTRNDNRLSSGLIREDGYLKDVIPLVNFKKEKGPGRSKTGGVELEIGQSVAHEGQIRCKHLAWPGNPFSCWGSSREHRYFVFNLLAFQAKKLLLLPSTIGPQLGYPIHRADGILSLLLLQLWLVENQDELAV